VRRGASWGFDEQRGADPLDAPGWRAAIVGSCLALICGTSLFALLAQSNHSASSENPRRELFASIWPSIIEGRGLSEVVAALGPADETESRFEQIPACPDPCSVPCSTFHTCVSAHSWYSSLAEDQAEIYSLCTDDADIVRRTSKGVSFRLSFSSGPHDDLAGFVAWQAFATVLGVPVAVGLWLWHRWRPVRFNGLGHETKR